MAPLAEARLREQPFGLDVHPSRKLVAAGLITGQLKLFEWGDDDAAAAALGPRAGRQLLRQRWSARPHKEGACRVVRFSADGASVFSAGGDRTLQQRDVETNQPTWRIRRASDAPVNALVRLSEVGVATGDDEGGVSCWDLRAKTVALKFRENTDYISDLLYSERARGGGGGGDGAASGGGGHNTLVAAGGDSFLSVFDLRRGRLWARSDPQDDELLCLALCKGGRKLLCGTQSGVVGIYSWGSFGDVSDRLLGHPASVDCMLPYGDDAVLTGSSDGLIRLVSVLPNKVLGVVGEHDDEAIVEAMAMDAAGATLATCAHDQRIRLWDLAALEEEDDGEEDEHDDDDDGAGSSSDDGDERKSVASSRAGSLVESMLSGEKRKRLRQAATKHAAIKMGAEFFSDM